MPPPVVLKQGVQSINTQREFNHEEEIIQAQHTDRSETSMRSSTKKTSSTTFSGSAQSRRSPAKNASAQDRYKNLFLRKKATGIERSFTGEKRQPVTTRDRQPPCDDSDASIDHRPSTAECNLSLPPRKPRLRVTFAYLKADDCGSDSQVDTANLSKFSSSTIPLPAHVSDILEPPPSFSPSPPPLDSLALALSSSPFVQEEMVVNDDMLISPASSPVLTSCPIPPTQASSLSGQSSSKANVDIATDSRTSIGTSDGSAEIEEARKRVLGNRSFLSSELVCWCFFAYGLTSL